MALIEEDAAVRAPVYERPLRYTYDETLDRGGGFHFVFDQGAIRCSSPLSTYASMCRIAPHDLSSLGSPSLGFVYLDAGRWGGTEYSFGLVSGRDVYLCEYVPGESWSDEQVPESRNPLVGNLLTQLWALNCGVRVLSYARATGPSPQPPPSDIHVLIPDFHLPPISWYFPSTAVSGFDPAYYRKPPDWFCHTEVYRRSPNLCDGWYGMRSLANSGRVHDADIFGAAGVHLVRFLLALTRLPKSFQSKVRVINMGDMAELWLDRDYQFEPSSNPAESPSFIAGGANRAADWVAEVTLWNMNVVEALRAVEHAGLASVSYLWGNHDAYLMSSEVCSQIGFPKRSVDFTGANGELHVEHGHRFDSSNFDNISSTDGPFWANAAYYFPAIRKAEPLGRGVTELIHGSPKERDCYLIGASLIYLHQKFVQKKQPFGIFCMGHTHARMLRKYNIAGQYSLWGGVQ